jgi:hypothetical protein
MFSLQSGWLRTCSSSGISTYGPHLREPHRTGPIAIIAALDRATVDTGRYLVGHIADQVGTQAAAKRAECHASVSVATKTDGRRSGGRRH